MYIPWPSAVTAVTFWNTSQRWLRLEIYSVPTCQPSGGHVIKLLQHKDRHTKNYHQSYIHPTCAIRRHNASMNILIVRANRTHMVSFLRGRSCHEWSLEPRIVFFSGRCHLQIFHKQRIPNQHSFLPPLLPSQRIPTASKDTATDSEDW